MGPQALPRRPVQAVIFDLDGLLVDTEPVFEEAARRQLARHNVALDREIFRSMMGTPARESFQMFRDGHGLAESVTVLMAENAAAFYEVLGDKPVPLMKGVLGLLDRLDRHKIPKALATSSTRDYVERILTPHRLLPRFSLVLTANDVQRGKPHPEIYLKAAARLGHDPREVVVLEDSVNGLRAARAAGAPCIVVPHDLVPCDQLTGAYAVLPSLEAPELDLLLGLGSDGRA